MKNKLFSLTSIIFSVLIFSGCAVAGLAELFTVEELTVLRAASGLAEVGGSIAVADEALLLSNLTRLRLVSRAGAGRSVLSVATRQGTVEFGEILNSRTILKAGQRIELDGLLHRANTQGTNIRSYPTIPKNYNENVIGKMDKGRIVLVENSENGWCKVKVDNKLEGWVKDKLLDAIQGSEDNDDNNEYNNQGNIRSENPNNSYQSIQPKSGITNIRITCSKCSGHRSINCNNCSGSGKSSCSVCYGSRSLRCKSCNGGGTNVCVYCQGTGNNNNRNNCSGCNGYGYRVCGRCKGHGHYMLVSRYNNQSRRVRCDGCDGYGKFTCDRCYGESARNQVCTYCNGRRITSCSKCEGLGQANCNTCQGTGNTICSICSGNGKTTCDKCSGEGYTLQTR